MSYCRWSTDNFTCDLNAYEDRDGYVIEVASNRHIGDCPIVDWEGFLLRDTRVDRVEMAAQQDARAAFLASCAREPINLPHAGETIRVGNDLDAFEAQFRALRELGYRFPDDVFDDIDYERRVNSADHSA